MVLPEWLMSKKELNDLLRVIQHAKKPISQDSTSVLGHTNIYNYQVQKVVLFLLLRLYPDPWVPSL